MRKKFLIKPALQVRHLTWTLCVVLFSCLIGYILFESMFTSALVQIGVLGPDLIHVQTLSRWGFFVILLILLSAIGVENYLLFHKFIGPLYALEKGLKKMSEGDLSTSVHIRETDQLSDLIHAFEAMREEIRSRLSSQEQMAKLLTENTTATNLEALKDQLEQIRKQIERKVS